MNIIKLTEGLKDATEGIQGCAVLARPMIAELKNHKKQLEAEEATPVKKWGFLLGFAALNVLENWNVIRDDVMEIKDGVVEIIQAIKEPDLDDAGFDKEKEKIEAKQVAKCQAINKPKKGKVAAADPEPATRPET